MRAFLSLRGEPLRGPAPAPRQAWRRAAAMVLAFRRRSHGGRPISDNAIVTTHGSALTADLAVPMRSFRR